MKSSLRILTTAENKGMHLTFTASPHVLLESGRLFHVDIYTTTLAQFVIPHVDPGATKKSKIDKSLNTSSYIMVTRIAPADGLVDEWWEDVGWKLCRCRAFRAQAYQVVALKTRTPAATNGGASTSTTRALLSSLCRLNGI